MADAGGDLGLGQQDQPVHQIAAHGEGQPVLQPDAATQTVGQSRQFRHLDRVAGGKARGHGGAALHADADDADIRAQGLGGQRHPREQPAPRQRHGDGCGIGDLIQNLQPQRALPGDYIRMVKGRDQREAFVALQTVGLGKGLILTVADDADLGPKRRDGIQLVLRHQPRDADHCRQALRARRMRQCAAVIAGRGGGDPGHIAQPRHRIGGAAQLEGAGVLAVFAFQPDRAACPRRQAGRGLEGRHPHLPGNAVAGGKDIVDAYHVRT